MAYVVMAIEILIRARDANILGHIFDIDYKLHIK